MWSPSIILPPTPCWPSVRSSFIEAHALRPKISWRVIPSMPFARGMAPGPSVRGFHWDDPRGSFIYSNNCGQRVVLENGDILLAFSFGSTSDHRSVATLRCRFNGETLSIAQVGTPLELKAGGGLLEPSLTRFGDRFYLTLRAEDGRGYLAVSQDGLHWNRKETWKWEDGQPLDLSSTQQHWLTHGEELFLVYTRKAMENQNVIRWRAPLWMARVNLEQHRLIRSSEQVVFPMIGDGVSQPDEVALMGNFHITLSQKMNPGSRSESGSQKRCSGQSASRQAPLAGEVTLHHCSRITGPLNCACATDCLSSWSHAHSLVGILVAVGFLAGFDSQSASRVGWPATSGGGRHWSLADCRRAHRGPSALRHHLLGSRILRATLDAPVQHPPGGLVFYGGFIGASDGMIYLRKKPLAIAENGRCPGAQHRPGSCLWPSGLPHDRLLFWKSMRFTLGDYLSSRSCDPSASGSPHPDL